MSTKKYLLIVLLLFQFIAYSNNNGNSKNEKMFFGGGLGIGLGSNYTSIEVSPQIGYQPIYNLYTGVKLIYQHHSGSYMVGNNTYDYRGSIYGGSLFAMNIWFNKIVAYAEYELLDVDKSLVYYSEKGRLWVGSPIVGGGISQNFGNSRLVFLVLWNFNSGKYVPYSNPILRFSFMF